MAERTNPHANLIIGAQDEASPVFDKIKASSQGMAEGVKQAAKQAAKETQLLGDEAEKSHKKMNGLADPAVPAAQKFQKSTESMIRQVRLLNAEIEAGGRNNSAFIEKKASIYGADTLALAPYLADLKKAEAAQRVATTGLDQMGMSAKQTTAALRQVPMQFTDIVVSLQGGQSAMQVFLQQGGQLKDMFGGAGNAARALGGYVLGLVNPFTVAAAAGVTLAVAYNQGSKEADAYRLAIVSTGNAAGTTGAQLKGYAQEISSVIGTQGKAAESLAAFVSTGRVSRDVLKEASQAAIAWERATGQAVGATAKQFADLGKDPLQAVLKLNEGTNFLTESVYRQIKSLEEQGKTADAAAVAQRAYADALTGRAGEIERNLGSIETAWNKVKDAAKGGWDAILNVGRAETNQDRLAATRKQIADLENRLAAGSGFSVTAGGAATGRPDAANNARLQAQLLGLQAQAAALEGVAFAAKTAAEAEAERAKQMQATAAWDKEGAKYLTDKAKLERDLTVARNEGLAAGKSQAEIEKRLAQIRDSYAKKGGSGGIAAENKDLRDQQRIFAELADVSSTYYADLATAQQQRAKGNLSEAQYVKYVEELIQKQPFAVAAAKAHAEAIKEEAKAAAESSKALSAWAEVRAKESQGLQAQINARREEVTLMGMTTEAVVAYTQAKYEQQAAEKEAYAAALESASFYAGEYAEAYNIAAEAARNQAKQLRELGGLEVEKVNKEAAKKAKDEWQRASDDINRSLTDALMRGFESGKDFAKNMRDTVINMFKTMVLRPVISAVLAPVAGLATGAANAMTGGGGGGGLMGMASNANSLYNAGMGGNASLMFSDFGMGLTNSVYSAGGALTNMGLDSLGSSVTSFANSISGFSDIMTTAGDAFGYASSIFAAADGKWGQAAGSAIGTYFGGPIGSFIGSTIGSAVDNIFSGDAGTYHTGGAAQYSAATGLRTSLGFRDNEEGLPSYNPNDNIDHQFGTGFGYVERGDQTISAVSTLAQALGTALDGVAVSFGQKAGYEIATAFADDTSEDGAWGALRISKDGQELLNWQDTRTSRWAPKEFGDGEAGYKEYLAAVAKDTRQVLLDMDLPSWADKMLESIGDSASMEQLTGVLTQIGVVQSAFVALGNSMEMFANLSGEMQSGLLAAAGSIDALTAGAGAFYQGFYSEQERVDAAVAQINKALTGLDLSIDPTLGDDAKAQFRAEVEKAFAAGDADLAAGLLSISGNFASAADYFEQLSQSAADAAAQAAGQAAQVAELSAAEQASIAGDLRRQIYELTGDTEAIRRLEIAGMNAANVALYDRIQALQAEQEAQAEAQRAAETMQSLQIELYRAQGNNLAAVALERERELAALAQFGPAAVAMQQQIYGLIDAMAASNAAANAYFADIDRAAAEQGYTDDAQAALDAMFGSISGGADAAAQSAASAAADAAKSAAASWRSAASSIKSSLEKLRADTTALSDPASRYAETKSVLDEYTRLALGGDASAAEKLAGAAGAFLSASADGTMTQAEYLRDRVLTEAKLASVMESSEAQASLQESIASSAGAAVSELQALNSNLTGFAGDLYNLLRSSYSDVGRDGATGIAATYAKMQADFEAYFRDNTRFAVGSQYSDPSFGGASFTKLDNNMAQFTGADGVVNYLRAGESLLDVAKRIPELRKLWEQQYGIRLPAFDVGTNYVPKDMFAQIHEGEAIVPKAFNPWANGGGSTGADNAEVVAELRAVTAQLVKLEARLAEIEKTNDQMAQQQDNGTDGGNAYRAEIMNVDALAQAIKEATA